ncbi:MAG: N-6 DNA methylase, partial [Myxococcota bacterium]|nr:N-6 DNA methylase [Myxococcota bacterium]
LFMEQHEKRYRRVYDGILFPHGEEDDPTGVETLIREWWLKGRAFQTIVRGMYHPNPYRFDLIPLDLLGGIYERFLGKRLRVVGNDVQDEFKPEYQRTKGAVYTPSWVVRRIIDRTLGPLTEGKDPEAILHLRVVDPACGSGSFLIGIYDHIERAVLAWCADHRNDPRAGEFTVGAGGDMRLRPQAARVIIDNCLYGVDIDAEAVEVARMSLALRFVEGAAQDAPDEPSELLRSVGRNVRHGNSLVGPEFAGLGFDPDRVRKVMPFDWASRRHGFGDVIEAGGFDAVVGNPPYIEVKRYKEWLPEMFDYLKKSSPYETAREGKTDISMPFMERAVGLLGPGGRMGFIIQNRFFRTDYGKLARRWLRTNRLVEEIDDFRDVQIFAGRTTYTAILVLCKGNMDIRYRTYADAAAAEVGEPCLDYRIPLSAVDDGVWSFDQPDLMAVHTALAGRHGAIGDHKEMHITVGLQVLYGKIYQLEPLEVTKTLVTGRNGLDEEARLERKSLRPLCRNRGFYPFRTDNADAWVIFPYDIKDDEAHEICWTQIKERFKRTAAYLEEHRNVLKKAVEVPKGAGRWHLYLYPKNLVEQAKLKVLFPMTIEDTMAAVDLVGDVYQDNVNVNSLGIHGADEALLKAVAAVFNSSPFSALARLKAGLLHGGWRQFNRQFAALVPFPLVRLKEPPRAARLAALADRIQGFQEKVSGPGRGNGEGARAAVESSLATLWLQLDAEVEDLYDLTTDEREVIRRYPRRVDRVDLLFRQTTGGVEAPVDDE